MSNLLSFEKFEFPPIEGLLDNMKNMRLFGEVRSAVANIEQATSTVSESPVLTNETIENRKIRVPIPLEPVEPVVDTPVVESPEAPSNVISLEATRAEILAIHAQTPPELEIPDELKVA